MIQNTLTSGGRPTVMSVPQQVAPDRQPHIRQALQALTSEHDSLLGAYSELMKRLTPVSRQEPAKESGNAPEGSCGCSVADEIFAVSNALSRLRSSVQYQIDTLEV